MEARDVIDLFESQRGLAGLLGLSNTAVSVWHRNNEIPTKHWVGVMSLCKTELGVKVKCTDLIKNELLNYKA